MPVESPFPNPFTADRSGTFREELPASSTSREVGGGLCARLREVHSCRGLLPGDTIEAHRDGIVHFIGEVTETPSAMDLFWAVSAYGERRIIEFSEFSVHLAVTEATSLPGGAGGETADDCMDRSSAKHSKE